MIFKNHEGFSLLEIMIATSLLGILSLGTMSVMRTMQKGQVASETKLEELELKRIISTLLTDQVACENTLVNKNIGTPVTQIKNNANAVVFETNNTYGNNSIKITAMSTQDLGVVSNGTRTINLNLAMLKMKQMSGGGTKVVSIQLNVAAPSATGVISECFVDANQIITTANIQSCASFGGVWDTAAIKCTLPSCPPGQVLQAISPTTGAVCKSMTCTTPGTFFTGLDASGNPICQAATYN